MQKYYKLSKSSEDRYLRNQSDKQFHKLNFVVSRLISESKKQFIQRNSGRISSQKHNESELNSVKWRSKMFASPPSHKQQKILPILIQNSFQQKRRSQKMKYVDPEMKSAKRRSLMKEQKFSNKYVDDLTEYDVEEAFYRQVNILQQFKRLSSMAN